MPVWQDLIIQRMFTLKILTTGYYQLQKKRRVQTYYEVFHIVCINIGSINYFRANFRDCY